MKSHYIRRWHLYTSFALIVILLAGLGLRHAAQERTQREREIQYQKALDSYSEALKTGMSRKQVEDYLRAKNVPVAQTCCVRVKEFSKGVYDNTYDDIVKIAEEDAPWVCSDNNVYIAFQFLGSYKDSLPRADSSDKLKDVTIYHRLEGCP